MMPWKIIFEMLGVNLFSILADHKVIGTDSNSSKVKGKVSDHTLKNWLCGRSSPNPNKVGVFISDLKMALQNCNVYIDSNFDSILTDVFSFKKPWEIENLPSIYNSEGDIFFPYTQYVLSKLQQTSNDFIQNLYDSNSDKLIESNFQIAIKELFSSWLPKRFLYTNIFNHTVSEPRDIDEMKSEIIRMRIDSLLFVITAFDVEASENYIKGYHDEEGSKFVKFLPEQNNGRIRTPMDLWMDHLKNRTQCSSLKAFVKRYITPKGEDTDSDYRKVMRWKNATIFRHMPQWNSIKNLLDNIIKGYEKRIEFQEILMTWGKIIYGITRIFQSILSMLIYLKRHKYIGFEIEDLLKLRRRYLMWYNYHLKEFHGYNKKNYEPEGRA
jgi:hypothetical protein